MLIMTLLSCSAGGLTPTFVAGDTLGVRVDMGQGDLAIGDVTGDGRDDFVTVDDWLDTVRVTSVPDLEQAPTRAAFTPSVGDRAPILGDATLGDLDGDGVADLLFNVGSWDSGAGTPWDMEGQVHHVPGPILPDATVTHVPLTDLRWEAWHSSNVALGDTNGDGVDDFVTAWADGSIYLASLVDEGPFDFSVARARAVITQQEEGFPPYPRVHAIGDIDGDGNEDLAVVDDLRPRDPSDDRTFIVPTRAFEGDQPIEVLGATLVGEARLYAGGDVDGDGADDLLVTTTRQVCLVTEVPTSGTWTLDQLGRCAETPNGVALRGAAILPDLDGDGHDELAVSYSGFEPVTDILWGGAFLDAPSLTSPAASIQGGIDPRRAHLTETAPWELVVFPPTGPGAFVVPADVLRDVLDRR